MKVILMKDFGSADHLYIGEAKTPAVNPGEVLVKVKATALNRADLQQRRGMYPPIPGESNILGLEMSGEVVELGAGVSSHSIGDRVCSLLPGGGYAQYVSVPEGLLIKIPDTMTFEQAAAFPETFLTSYQSLFSLGQLRKGQIVLVHAGASGIGSAALQLIKLAGATALITAGSDRKIEYCVQLGAKAGWNYKKGPFLPFINEYTNGNGVNIILDCIGAPYFAQNIQSLVPDGKLVIIGSLGEKIVNQLDLGTLLLKRFQLLRTTLRSRPLNRKIELTKELLEFLGDHFANGRVVPIIDTIFDWKEVREAHQYMEANKNKGKIVLRVTE
ncbi:MULTISPECIES: NAD(P)H-quinone oxidoreductase [Neobacillus]|uniref:NAD(P)H-quinone oxidoreductase n=1 Tax=Neobacillus citreus TaxID=2833578 RepID=A0A942T3C3_9BACI|nr:NAD(P)H-quinone oxidoreductase [Neobacillus citreus]MCH6264238.1 NAD(P)H-quinone oxidoreductase [Neobacillus citreus]